MAKNKVGYSSLSTATYSENSIVITQILFEFIDNNFSKGTTYNMKSYLLHSKARVLPSANKKKLDTRLYQVNKYLNELDKNTQIEVVKEIAINSLILVKAGKH